MTRILHNRNTLQDTAGPEPVLSDIAFEAKRKGVLEALPAECWSETDA